MHVRCKSDILSDDHGGFNVKTFSFILSIAFWSSFVGRWLTVFHGKRLGWDCRLNT